MTTFTPLHALHRPPPLSLSLPCPSVLSKVVETRAGCIAAYSLWPSCVHYSQPFLVRRSFFSVFMNKTNAVFNTIRSGIQATELSERGKAPTRNADGQLVFKDAPTFRPVLSPEQIIRLGAFGGTYWRQVAKHNNLDF